jgi:hypothetical protein
MLYLADARKNRHLANRNRRRRMGSRNHLEPHPARSHTFTLLLVDPWRNAPGNLILHLLHVVDLGLLLVRVNVASLDCANTLIEL